MISSQFIQSCQSGDESAIETLVRTYQRAVFQLALSIIDDGQEPDPGNEMHSSATAEAEAATRQTFIVAIDRMGRYREDTNFESWLFRIAVEVSRQRAQDWKTRRWASGVLRRAMRSITRREPPGTGPTTAADRSSTEPAEKPAPQPDPRLHAGDVELWSSVRSLDEKLRVPIVLRYYHDYPIEEIAHLLRISEGTVHARLDAAREKIARQMEKKDETG